MGMFEDVLAGETKETIVTLYRQALEDKAALKHDLNELEEQVRQADFARRAGAWLRSVLLVQTMAESIKQRKRTKIDGSAKRHTG